MGLALFFFLKLLIYGTFTLCVLLIFLRFLVFYYLLDSLAVTTNISFDFFSFNYLSFLSLHILCVGFWFSNWDILFSLLALWEFRQSLPLFINGYISLIWIFFTYLFLSFLSLFFFSSYFYLFSTFPPLLLNFLFIFIYFCNF